MIAKFRQSLGAISIGLGLFGLDWLTKWLANANLPFEQQVQAPLPYVTWFRTFNTGYHYLFGEISNFRLVQTLGLVAVLVLIYMMIDRRSELQSGDPSRTVFGAFVTLLIGATGNPFETLFFGRVTDFFVFRPLPWPSNLADQYINLAIYVLLPIWFYLSFREWREKKKAEEEETGVEEVRE